MSETSHPSSPEAGAGNSPGSDLRSAVAQLIAPLRDTAATTARLVKHVGVRLDAMSLELARDLGEVTRDVQSLVGVARDRARGSRSTR